MHGRRGRRVSSVLEGTKIARSGEDGTRRVEIFRQVAAVVASATAEERRKGGKWISILRGDGGDLERRPRHERSRAPIAETRELG